MQTKLNTFASSDSLLKVLISQPFIDFTFLALMLIIARKLIKPFLVLFTNQSNCEEQTHFRCESFTLVALAQP